MKLLKTLLALALALSATRTWAPLFPPGSGGGVTSVTCSAPFACSPSTGAVVFSWTSATIATTPSVGDMLYASSSTQYSNLAAVASGSALLSQGVGTAPAWGPIATINASSVNVGDLLYGATSSSYSNLAAVAAGSALVSQGVNTAPAWSPIATINASSVVVGDILYGATATTYNNLADVAVGSVLVSGGVATAPLWQKDKTGTTTADEPCAGCVGEVQSCTLAVGSLVTLTTNTTANICTINTLSAGDWDCTGVVDFQYGATTSVTNLEGGISPTSATLGARDTFFDYETAANVPTAGADSAWVIPTVRKNISSATQFWLVAQGTFTVSTLKAYGTLRCRRMR